MKKLGILLAAIAGAFFLSILSAIMSARFWGWFEERTGIESLGHSGPATWVYIALWVFWSVILAAIFFRTFLRARR